MISASNSVPSAARDPGWGDRDRPTKALAILATCRRVIGSDFSRTRWLDIGCGCGDIAATIAPHVGHITGIDPSPWQRWPALRALHPNLDFIHGNFEAAEKIPSPDVIVCNQVYEHVEDPRRLIRLIHGILKPSGHVYFAGPNLLFPVEPHVFWPFVHWLPRSAAVKIMRTLRARYVVTAHSVTIWELRRWFQGFEVFNALPIALRHPVDYGRNGLLWHALAMLPHGVVDVLTAFSPGFIFVLRKQASSLWCGQSNHLPLPRASP
jgi:2-polyprenyl-3-methyl-5-hydroxy-6-metoxy-1,4-benzoquinol methylase